MKKLAENRAAQGQGQADDKPQEANSAPRTYIPEGNPLLNGLASLALEAAQKKKAISATSLFLYPPFCQF